ncbi:hypothetical protein ACN47E_009532 [Coniothyrium glycines]
MKEELVIIRGGSSGFGYEMMKGVGGGGRVVQTSGHDQSVEELCEQIRQTHSEASVLVNNAGIGLGKTVLEQVMRNVRSCSKSTRYRTSCLSASFFLVCFEQRKATSLLSLRWRRFSRRQDCSTVAAPRLVHRIRAECLTRYPRSEGICTTSTHLSWHQTGILRSVGTFLAEYGIVLDSPSNVSDLAVE